MIYAELERALEEGIPVVRASRCGSGEVVDSSPEWTEAGMINAGTLNPQKARVLLQLCLAAGYCHEKTAEVFLKEKLETEDREVIALYKKCQKGPAPKAPVRITRLA